MAGLTKIKRVTKDWGYEDWFANEEQANYCGKLLTILAGHCCSLHRHLRKDESFYVLHGTMQVEMAYTPSEPVELHIVKAGQALRIPTGCWHRMRPVGDIDVCFIEVSTYHSDDDVERLIPGGIVTADRELAMYLPLSVTR